MPGTRTRKAWHGSRSGPSGNQDHQPSPSGQPTTAATAITPRNAHGAGTLVLLESGRLVHVPVNQRRNTDGALCEQQKEDREAVLRLQDRLQAGSRHTFIHKLLRAYDAGQRGGLSREEMRCALERLNMGLTTHEVDKVITRLCPPGQADLIPHNALIDMVSNFQLLGARQLDNGQPTDAQHTDAEPTLKHTRRGVYTGAATRSSNPSTEAEKAANMDKARQAAHADTTSSSLDAGSVSASEAPASLRVAGRSVSTPPLSRQGSRVNNARTKAPWEPLLGCMHAWNWQVRPPGLAGVTSQAEPNSYDQRKQDALLVSLLSQRFRQSADQIRATFRKWDRARTGQLSKEQFVNALGSMHLQVPRTQLERLFDMADVRSAGQVDYASFIQNFHATAQKSCIEQQASLPASTTLPSDATEIQQAVQSPLTSALRQRLRAKGSAAHQVFAQYNSGGNSQLSLADLTKCCQMLVPGLTERHVGALLTACDPTGVGNMSYRDFVSKLVDDGHLTAPLAAADNSRRVLGPCVHQGHSVLLMRPWTSHEAEHTASVGPSQRPATSSSNTTGPATELVGSGACTTQQRPHTVPHSFSHSFSNTAWTREDQPVQGYTGTIARHLRPQRPQVVAAADKRVVMHQQGVSGMLESLITAPLKEEMPVMPDPNRLPCPKQQLVPDNCLGLPDQQAPTPEPGLVATTQAGAGAVTDPLAVQPTCMDDQAAALMPYDYEGAPPVPEGPHVRGKGLVSGACDLHAQSTEEASMDQRQRKAVRTRNLRPTSVLPTSMRMVYASMPEFSSRRIHSSMSTRQVPTNGSAWHSANLHPAGWGSSALPYPDVELQAAEDDTPQRAGKARFGLLSYPPTAHVTRVHPQSSQWAGADDTWVRKSDPSFLEFQQNDKQRAAQLQAAVCKIKAGNDIDLELRKAAKEVQVATHDANRLAVKGLTTARYREQCAMAEVARTANAESAQPFFNRQLHFTDHVLIDPMWART